MTATIAERVAAGAKFLDEHDPGWDQRIDLDRLNIGSSCNCILGQLHGAFSKGVRALNPDCQLEPDWDIALGFMWSAAHCRETNDEVTPLTAEWRRVIEARRSA